ncbi:CP2 transcription factor [Penicillium herquei]|nr:CP2 transcription factor [Penicillium herquei]
MEYTLVNNTQYYPGFPSHKMSHPKDSQAFQSDLNSHHINHPSLPLIDHQKMAGTTQRGNDGQYSPKHLVQMEEIYSVPSGSSSILQSDPWNSSFDISSQAVFQPWANYSGVETIPDEKMNSSPFGIMDISDHGMHIDSTPTSLPINNNDKSFETWKDNGFRFCAVLGAPTALTRNIKDATLSYLNKGQAYKLSIFDSQPQVVDGQTKKYRTFVRVAFDQEQSRSNPAACWQLWKEARAVNKNSQKEPFPLAVEFAGPVGSAFQYRIEQELFDGFCITWEMNLATGSNLCDILIRLHFLSTDFTRSKGVKGMPIRLCVKTQELASPFDFLHPEDPEISFCKIQLFRDHGAERKMSNDNDNLAKAIEKLKLKISSAATKSVSQKRKRASELADQILESIPASKLEIQHPNNHGMNSKLAELEQISLFTQPTTILALRASREDDPDLYPVHMPDYQESDNSFETSPMDIMTIKSNRSDSEGLTSIGNNYGGGKAGIRTALVNQRHRIGSTSSAVSSEQLPSPGISPAQFHNFSSLLTQYCKVACFYVRLMLESSQQFYRAIYLSERTTHDLAQAISRKYGITITDNLNVLHVGDKNIKVLVDDEFVEQIPEGQHMDIQLDENASLDGITEFCAMRLLY